MPARTFNCQAQGVFCHRFSTSAGSLLKPSLYQRKEFTDTILYERKEFTNTNLYEGKKFTDNFLYVCM